MLTLPKEAAKNLPSLKEYENLIEKIEAIYDYLKIDAIYLAASNPSDYPNPDVKLLHVTEMVIPGSTPSYLKSKLGELHAQLRSDLNIYLFDKDDHQSILENLERCIKICNSAAKENDRNDRYGFNEAITYYLYVNGDFKNVLPNWLVFSEDLKFDYEEHFAIRKGFYLQVAEEFSQALNIHVQKTDFSKKPYYWDSPNAELEISELIHNLYYLTQRIRINSNSGATFAKFKRDFFGLFGLTDDNYSKKENQIRHRKFNEGFITRMAAALNKDDAKL